MRISLLLPTWRSRRFTGIGRPGEEGTDGKAGDQGDSRSDHPQGTRNFWRSIEASGEPGDGLWSSNAARKPRSRKGSRLTSVRRIGQPGLLRRFELADLGRFSCSKRPHAFCNRDKGGGGTPPHSLKLFCFLVFVSLQSASRLPIEQNPGRRLRKARKRRLGAARIKRRVALWNYGRSQDF